MPPVRKTKPTASQDDSGVDRVFDDAEALIALAQSSFLKAARAEVALNDRLGIATHGASGGEIVTRRPAKPRKTAATV
jgi:hypothetical protein